MYALTAVRQCSLWTLSGDTPDMTTAVLAVCRRVCCPFLVGVYRLSSSSTEDGPHQLPSFEPPDALLEADLLEVKTCVDTQNIDM